MKTSQESSPTQENAKGKDNSSSNYELIEREEIENSPFTIITITDQKICFIAMGMHKLSVDYEIKRKEELKEIIEKRQWMLIFDMINSIYDTREEMKKLTQN